MTSSNGQRWLIKVTKIDPIFAFNALKDKTIIAILRAEADCHGQIRCDFRTERHVSHAMLTGTCSRCSTKLPDEAVSGLRQER